MALETLQQTNTHRTEFSLNIHKSSTMFLSNEPDTTQREFAKIEKIREKLRNPPQIPKTSPPTNIITKFIKLWTGTF